MRRVLNRFRCAYRFARAGVSTSDRLKLSIAGLARHNPINGQSLYDRVFSTFAVIEPRIRGGRSFRVRLDLTNLVDPIVFEELVLDGVYPLKQVPFTPDLIIDAGACHGLFTLMACAHFPTAQVVCIEPEPGNIASLRANLALNDIDAAVYEGALTASSGPVSFAGGGFGGRVGVVSADSISVASVNLCDILAKYRPSSLLLKMDIEGAEAEVLPAIAACLPSAVMIFLETHHTDPLCDQYLSPFDHAGFTRTEIRRRRGEVPGSDYVERALIRV